ncbi:MAG TPA: hypothetical protein VJ873_01525 [bacterium]|nr:hypothetical protein [bacterium]
MTKQPQFQNNKEETVPRKTVKKITAKKTAPEEIAPDFNQLLRIWWAFAWRNLLVSLATMMVMFVVGCVIGFIMGLMGANLTVIKIICGFLGFLFGIAVSILPVKLVVGKDFGDFRLAVLKK